MTQSNLRRGAWRVRPLLLRAADGAQKATAWRGDDDQSSNLVDTRWPRAGAARVECRGCSAAAPVCWRPFASCTPRQRPYHPCRPVGSCTYLPRRAAPAPDLPPDPYATRPLTILLDPLRERNASHGGGLFAHKQLAERIYLAHYAICLPAACVRR